MKRRPIKKKRVAKNGKRTQLIPITELVELQNPRRIVSVPTGKFKTIFHKPTVK